MTRRGLFIDRDGIINELVFYASHGEWEGPRRVEDVTLRPGIAETLQRAADKGFLLFLVTNQPSFAKGKCSLEDLERVQEEIVGRLTAAGVVITESYVCYHHPESIVPGYGPCECRKPSPLFLIQAAERYGLDLKKSWMAGDQDTDVETGRRAGCRTALIKYEHSQAKRGASSPDLLCSDLAELVQKID